jgi:hypothetical protein
MIQSGLPPVVNAQLYALDVGGYPNAVAFHHTGWLHTPALSSKMPPAPAAQLYALGVGGYPNTVAPWPYTNYT